MVLSYLNRYAERSRRIKNQPRENIVTGALIDYPSKESVLADIEDDDIIRLLAERLKRRGKEVILLNSRRYG